MKHLKSQYKNLTQEQLRNFGIVTILVLIALSLWLKTFNLLSIALVACFLTIIIPEVLRPFAFIWYSLSLVLGMVSSKILLSIIFFVLVTPVGILRRLSGHDNLKLKQFKKNKQSVMIDRSYLYTAEDLKDTF